MPLRHPHRVYQMIGEIPYGMEIANAFALLVIAGAVLSAVYILYKSRTDPEG